LDSVDRASDKIKSKDPMPAEEARATAWSGVETCADAVRAADDFAGALGLSADRGRQFLRDRDAQVLVGRALGGETTGRMLRIVYREAGRTVVAAAACEALPGLVILEQVTPELRVQAELWRMRPRSVWRGRLRDKNGMFRYAGTQERRGSGNGRGGKRRRRKKKRRPPRLAHGNGVVDALLADAAAGEPWNAVGDAFLSDLRDLVGTDASSSDDDSSSDDGLDWVTWRLAARAVQALHAETLDGGRTGAAAGHHYQAVSTRPKI
jgi:hypothetical protein